MRIATAQYLAAVAASNSSVTSSERIAKSSKTPETSSSAPRKEKKSKSRSKEPKAAAPVEATEPDELKIIGTAPGSTLVPSEPEPEPVVNKAMVEAESAVSTKSVRFSEKVETHEPEEVQAPDVPSLMDDQPEEDETASVESSPEPAAIAVVEESDDEAPKKKKNFFKKIFRGKKKGKKTLRSKDFQPTLKAMDEKEEVENDGESVIDVDAPGDESVSSAATAKSGNKSSPTPLQEVPPRVIPPSEGFELIAGCTKTGKKAIMIAKAKNERKRHSADPEPAKQASQDPPSAVPPTAANDKKDATSVVAKEERKSRSIIAEEKKAEPKLSPDATASKHETLSWMWFAPADESGAEDKNVTEALDVIQQHANKHGVTERELMDHIEAKDNESVDNTFVSEGDSLYHGDSTVASKLLNMFDSIFAVEGAEEEDDDTVGT